MESVQSFFTWTLFLFLYPLLSGNIGKCTRAARMLYGSFAPHSFTNWNAMDMALATMMIMRIPYLRLMNRL